VKTTRAKGIAEEDYGPDSSCKDSFRYRLVEENGRHRFRSVRFVGTDGCASEELATIVEALEGKWLDEVDVDSLQRIQCGDGRCRGCSGEAAKMISAIREVLLPK